MTEPCPQPISSEAAAALIGPLTELVIRAGAAILAVNRCAMKVDGKSDGSPVTEADLAADRIIADGLARIVPQIPSLSEERVHQATPPYRGCFFLIDPLDGTKEFVAGRERVHGQSRTGQRRPAAARLRRRAGARPRLARAGRARRRAGDGGRRHDHCGRADPHAARPPRGQPWTVAVSRSHGDSRTEGFIHARPGAVRAELGSAVKFGRVAEGRVDIYPRLGPTSEWDVAAGHAVVTAAGGKVTDSNGR